MSKQDMQIRPQLTDESREDDKYSEREVSDKIYIRKKINVDEDEDEDDVEEEDVNEDQMIDSYFTLETSSSMDDSAIGNMLVLNSRVEKALEYIQEQISISKEGEAKLIKLIEDATVRINMKKEMLNTLRKNEEARLQLSIIEKEKKVDKKQQSDQLIEEREALKHDLEVEYEKIEEEKKNTDQLIELAKETENLNKVQNEDIQRIRNILESQESNLRDLSLKEGAFTSAIGKKEILIEHTIRQYNELKKEVAEYEKHIAQIVNNLNLTLEEAEQRVKNTQLKANAASYKEKARVLNVENDETVINNIISSLKAEISQLENPTSQSSNETN